MTLGTYICLASAILSIVCVFIALHFYNGRKKEIKRLREALKERSNTVVFPPDEEEFPDEEDK
jgi:Na+/melibiose symporter-like transporter